MASVVMSSNEARLPFLGTKMSFIVGLDPLGFQNTSVQTYSYLLPGLNNVTWRIRNYSFYCWLLAEYSKQIRNTNPSAQRIFIRRAEYIIALMSVRHKVSVSGSDYAKKRIEAGIKEFDLQSGTYNDDASTPGTYWQHPSGVFGQYYVGAMRQMGLIDEPVDQVGQSLKIYRRTPRSPELKVSGEDLALAFDQNISSDNKTLFLSCIHDGKVTLRSLDLLFSSFVKSAAIFD
jgi:hypothetical protein